MANKQEDLAMADENLSQAPPSLNASQSAQSEWEKANNVVNLPSSSGISVDIGMAEKSTPVDSGSNGQAITSSVMAKASCSGAPSNGSQGGGINASVTGTEETLFKYDVSVHQSIVNAKPWERDPHYFKSVKVSAVAMLKMLIHARSGGNIEVMGMLIGKVAHQTMIVVDVSPLPVEGTETRVNAQAEAYEYMTSYKETVARVGRTENVLGWYHSHPGYGCWLSGIDVTTQTMNQTYQEPFVAIVVDPIRTISSGKVNIGAFRTYPAGYRAPDEGQSEYQSIPMDKIEDFGVHCKQYYPLEVSHFKSVLDKRLLDLLWNKYWVSTLSSVSILSQPNYLCKQTRDLANKIYYTISLVYQMELSNERVEDQVSKDATKMTMEQLHALTGQVINEQLFSINRSPADNSRPRLDGDLLSAKRTLPQLDQAAADVSGVEGDFNLRANVDNVRMSTEAS